MSETIMTDKELVEKLQSVITALNHVSCEGMQNLLNLGGSIGILNEVTQNLMVRLEHTEDKE